MMDMFGKKEDKPVLNELNQLLTYLASSNDSKIITIALFKDDLSLIALFWELC